MLAVANHRNRMSFNKRGMDWNTFRFYAPMAEEIVVGDPIIEAVIWNEFLEGDRTKVDSSVPSEPVGSMDFDLCGVEGWGRTGLALQWTI
jgi:hypothetical protein